MPPIRQSNRVRKPKVHWEPPPPTRRRRQPAFTIHADPSEDQPTLKDLGTQFPEDLDMQFPEDLGTQFPEDLDSEPAEDSDSESEDLDSESEDLNLELKDLVSQPEDPDSQPEDLDSDTSLEDHSYQPQFLSKDRAGRSHNLSEDTKSVKLFQLFFTVKEMKNIIKQTNQQAAYTNFETF